MNKLLEAALEYAANGIHVLPLGPKSKVALVGKEHHKGTTDPELIKKWWSKWPDANIGGAMGSKSGIIGVDVDYKDLCREDFLGDFPPTVIAASPNGGHHAYFKYKNGPIRNGLKIEQGATIRSDGSYFVLPPSIGEVENYVPSEKDPATLVKKVIGYQQYQYIDRGLIDGEIAELPELNIKEVHKHEPNKFKEGSRHDTLKTKAAELRFKKLGYDEIIKELTELNDKFEPPLESFDEIKKMAEWAAYQMKVSETTTTPAEDNDLKTKLMKKFWTDQKKKEIALKILDIRYKIYMTEAVAHIYNIKDIDKYEVERMCTPERLLNRLAKNIEEETHQVVSDKLTKSIFDMWKVHTTPLETEPTPFKWIDEPGWTFKRLNFKPSIGTYDAWKEFLYRLSSPDDFMAFVWSIFEKDSSSRQYLYLHDPYGQGGKSSVLNVLSEVLGNSATSINNSLVSGGGSRWIFSQLYGKRLVIYPDCKNPKFCMSEILRNMVSGDQVPIEFKGEGIFSERLYVKLIIASNLEPMITSQGADESRMIRINVQENTFNKNDSTWIDRLRNELPHFLFACKEIYDDKCKNHGDILLNEETCDLIQQSSESVEARFEDIVNRRIAIGENEKTSVEKWMHLCRVEKLDNVEMSNFKAYLRNLSPNIFIGRRKIKGKKESIYSGFSIVGDY